MSPVFRVGFCVSGQGRLCRAALVQRARLGIVPEFVLVEGKASVELEAFCDVHATRILRLPKLDPDTFRTRAFPLFSPDKHLGANLDVSP